jgi:hypothetical protein
MLNKKKLKRDLLQSQLRFLKLFKFIFYFTWTFCIDISIYHLTEMTVSFKVLIYKENNQLKYQPSQENSTFQHEITVNK